MKYGKTTLLCSAALILTGCGPLTLSHGHPREVVTTTVAVPSATTTDAPTAPASSTEPSSGSDGVAITPTGTVLPVGKTATVLYPTKSMGKVSTKLATTVVTAEKGSIDDLKGFDLDAQAKLSVPFYVTIKFRNVGAKTMDPAGIFGLIEAHNEAGDELGELDLIGDFKKCDGIPPKQLAVGESFTECAVYIAPKNQALDNVVFGFYLDTERTEITWTTRHS